MKEDNIMFLVKKRSNKIWVTCQICTDKGYVNPSCKCCGGRGIRKKSVEAWDVAQVEIIKINRDKNGELRYWTSLSEFFREADKYVHFTFADAEAEVGRRNGPLSTIDNWWSVRTILSSKPVYESDSELVIPLPVYNIKDEPSDEPNIGGTVKCEK